MSMTRVHLLRYWKRQRKTWPVNVTPIPTSVRFSETPFCLPAPQLIYTIPTYNRSNFPWWLKVVRSIVPMALWGARSLLTWFVPAPAGLGNMQGTQFACTCFSCPRLSSPSGFVNTSNPLPSASPRSNFRPRSPPLKVALCVLVLYAYPKYTTCPFVFTLSYGRCSPRTIAQCLKAFLDTIIDNDSVVNRRENELLYNAGIISDDGEFTSDIVKLRQFKPKKAK